MLKSIFIFQTLTPNVHRALNNNMIYAVCTTYMYFWISSSKIRAIIIKKNIPYISLKSFFICTVEKLRLLLYYISTLLDLVQGIWEIIIMNFLYNFLCKYFILLWSHTVHLVFYFEYLNTFGRKILSSLDIYLSPMVGQTLQN